jgi:hypothetical protein
MPELAYIDPGSGSLIIQAAIASLVAGVVFFRNTIARFLPGRREQPRDETSLASGGDGRREATSVDDAARGG